MPEPLLPRRPTGEDPVDPVLRLAPQRKPLERRQPLHVIRCDRVHQHLVLVFVQPRVADRDQDVTIPQLGRAQRLFVDVHVQVPHLHRGRVHDQVPDPPDGPAVGRGHLPVPRIRILVRDLEVVQVRDHRQPAALGARASRHPGPLGGVLRPRVVVLARVRARVHRRQLLFVLARDPIRVVVVLRYVLELLLRHAGDQDLVLGLVHPRLADRQEHMLLEKTEVHVEVPRVAALVEDDVVDLPDLLVVRHGPYVPAADIEGSGREGVVRLVRERDERHGLPPLCCRPTD